MNFIEYVYENTEGLVFIDKLRSAIRNIAYDGIKEEFEGATEEDIDKLSLMIEFNFIDGITSDDSEWDIKTISVDDVKFLIGSTIGFHNLCGGLDKNRRQSYSEILWDVIYHALSLIDDEEKLFKSHNCLVKANTSLEFYFIFKHKFIYICNTLLKFIITK